MKNKKRSPEALEKELEETKLALAEARETLRAISCGEIDALVVSDANGESVFNVINPEKLTDSILDQSAEAIFVCDNENVILRASKTATRMMGGQLEGARFADVFSLQTDGSPSAVHTPLDLDDILRKGGTRGLTVQIRNSEGKIRHYLLSAQPLKDPFDRIIGSTSTLMDISDRVTLEQDQKQLVEQEKLARAKAEEANSMKDEFLAMISHELRTPLTAMLGWTRILMAGNADPATLRKGYEVLDRNVKAQAKLIEDVLDVARIANGKIQLDFKAVDLVPLVEAALENLQQTSQAKNVTFKFSPATSVCLVYADPNRFQQIIWNLLTNANKFSLPGGTVVISLKEQNGFVHLDVTDSGIGIAPEFLPHVFERFTQAGKSHKRSAGLGLGLSIVKNLTELHGGQVSATSPGLQKGATFSIKLPILRSRDTARLEHDSPRGQTALTGKKILLVEDDADSRELFALILTGQGASVTAVDSVQAARKALQNDMPDLCLSDIGMPDEDGYSLLRHIRALDKNAGGGIPVIAVTAFAKPEDKQSALAAGFNAFLAKPVDVSKLVDLISTFV